MALHTKKKNSHRVIPTKNDKGKTVFSGYENMGLAWTSTEIQNNGNVGEERGESDHPSI